MIEIFRRSIDSMKFPVSLKNGRYVKFDVTNKFVSRYVDFIWQKYPNQIINSAECVSFGNLDRVVQIDNCIFSMAGSVDEKIVMPPNIEYVKKYYTDSYEGVYLKYKVGRFYGIWYISDTCVSIVISHEEEFTNIYFEDGYFYAEKENDEEKYYIIDEAGVVVKKSSYPCKKVNNFRIFYTDHKIITNKFEHELDIEISVIRVVNVEELRVLEITNEQGVYIYESDFTLHFGPIEESDILEALKQTLKKYRIRSSSYCLTGFCDDAICMEKQDNTWVVFSVDRGDVYLIKETPYIIEACIEIIKETSASEKSREKMISSFKETLYSMK